MKDESNERRKQRKTKAAKKNRLAIFASLLVLKKRGLFDDFDQIFVCTGEEQEYYDQSQQRQKDDLKDEVAF